MKCPELHMIEEYASGELSNGELRELETHLAICPSCGQLLERERRLADLLRSQPLLPAPPQLRLRVMRALEAEQALRSLPDWLWALGLGVVVVIVGLILGSLAAPYMEGLKGWAYERILQSSLWKGLTGTGSLPGSDWLAQFPSLASMQVLNLAIGGIILCWGLWQMIKALRR